MLLTIGAKYLYSNKNRDVSPDFEMYDGNKLDWNKESDRLSLIAMWAPIIIIDLILLYFAILMASRVAKNNKELILHGFSAIFMSLPYVFLSTVFDTPAFQTLKN
jgi:hypothetical protein